MWPGIKVGVVMISEIIFVTFLVSTSATCHLPWGPPLATRWCMWVDDGHSVDHTKFDVSCT